MNIKHKFDTEKYENLINKNENDYISKEFNEIFQIKNKNNNIIDNFNNNKNKIHEIITFLKLSGLYNKNLKDNSTIFYNWFGILTYSSIVFSKKRKPYNNFFRLIPVFLYDHIFSSYLIDLNGLIKYSIFCNDELSNEIKLLLQFYFPNNIYNKL